MNNSFVLRAAWMPADNTEKRTKGQWHKWLNEAFCFCNTLLVSFRLGK